MSSILKALRKLEKEKPQAGHSAANISVDQGTSAKHSGPLLPLLTGIVLGAALVGVLLLWQPGAPVSSQGDQAAAKTDDRAATSVSTQSSEQAEPQDKRPELTLESPRNAVKMTVGQHSAKTPGIGPVPVVVLPPETVATEVPRPSKPLPDTAVKPTFKAAEPPAAVSEQRTAPSRFRDVPVPAAVNSTASSKLPEGVTLRVSEIYYQDNGAGSMAVVNDLPVMIGSQVDAAVIKDIRADHVLVTIAGKLYAVALTRQ